MVKHVLGSFCSVFLVLVVMFCMAQYVDAEIRSHKLAPKLYDYTVRIGKHGKRQNPRVQSEMQQE